MVGMVLGFTVPVQPNLRRSLLFGFVDDNAASAGARCHHSNPCERVGLSTVSKLWDIDHRFKARITLFKTVRVPHAHIPWDEQ